MTRLEEHYLGLYLDGSKRAVGAADREALAQRLLREFSSAAAAALPNAEVG
jgi:Arc/MetJ family transcription regulator